MKIYLGTDHTGFELKEYLKTFLTNHGSEVEDCGAYELNPDDDYPDFISKVAQAISENPHARGIILGGSGEGEAMVANKFKNVRCALFYGGVKPLGAADVNGRMSDDPFEIIRLSRQHNDSNILSLGSRFLSKDDAENAVRLWLETPFSEEERHRRRVEKIRQLE